MTEPGPGHNDQLRSIGTKSRRFSKWENAQEHIRFFAKVIIDPYGCHLWSAYRNPAGYGQFSSRGSLVLAHRWAWEWGNGRPIPDGMHVCHSCDTPPCVNPKHLFLGTDADNHKDKVMKGRSLSGTKHKMVKLSEAEVLQIRASDATQAELAKRYKVAQATISRAKTGRCWSKLSGDASWKI